MNTKTLFSSSKHTWSTPWNVIHKLEERYGKFELDAAASEENKKANYYIDEAANSLHFTWHNYPEAFGVHETVKNVYLNPPYGRAIPTWLKKASEESKKGCQVVCLVPSRTGTKWFQQYVHGQASEVLFVSGRIKFEGADASAPFDSIVVVYKPGDSDTKYSTISFK